MFKKSWMPRLSNKYRVRTKKKRFYCTRFELAKGFLFLILSLVTIPFCHSFGCTCVWSLDFNSQNYFNIEYIQRLSKFNVQCLSICCVRAYFTYTETNISFRFQLHSEHHNGNNEKIGKENIEKRFTTSWD